MSDSDSTLCEVAFRFARLTILAYPQRDRVVLVPLGREPVAVTWGECMEAIRQAKEKSRER